MHYRRIVALLLGLWMGGALIMVCLARVSFQSVQRVMNASNPVFAVQTKPLGKANTEMVLRYEIAEENRYLFQNWEYMQLILGVAFFSYLLFRHPGGEVLARAGVRDVSDHRRAALRHLARIR